DIPRPREDVIGANHREIDRVIKTLKSNRRIADDDVIDDKDIGVDHPAVNAGESIVANGVVDYPWPSFAIRHVPENPYPAVFDDEVLVYFGIPSVLQNQPA